MRRWLFKIAAVLSLLVCAITGALWVGMICKRARQRARTVEDGSSDYLLAGRLRREAKCEGQMSGEDNLTTRVDGFIASLFVVENRPAVTTWIFGIIIAVGLIILNFLMVPTDLNQIVLPPKTLNFLIMITALISGGVIGGIFSPWKEDEKDYATFQKGITTLVSGYLLGKLDTIVSFFGGSSVLTYPWVLARCLLFFAWFALAAVEVYMSRRYFKDIAVVLAQRKQAAESAKGGTPGQKNTLGV